MLKMVYIKMHQGVIFCAEIYKKNTSLSKNVIGPEGVLLHNAECSSN